MAWTCSAECYKLAYETHSKVCRPLPTSEQFVKSMPPGTDFLREYKLPLFNGVAYIIIPRLADPLPHGFLCLDDKKTRLELGMKEEDEEKNIKALGGKCAIKAVEYIQMMRQLTPDQLKATLAAAANIAKRDSTNQQ